jgi:3D (Asp-Asp-Asp) domain-containing protein
VIFIPEAKGIKYIDIQGVNQTHNGYFFAGDTGSKILGNHIDVFIGTSKSNPFKFVKSNKNKTFIATIIRENNIIKRLEKIHKQIL